MCKASNDVFRCTVGAYCRVRWDITQACRHLAVKSCQGEIGPDNMYEELISRHLVSNGIPDPDLFIRTGGEQRISNFLLWQLAYSELYFTDALWPDFRAEAFEMALQSFAGRQRRFGRTGDQVEQTTDA